MNLMLRKSLEKNAYIKKLVRILYKCNYETVKYAFKINVLYVSAYVKLIRCVYVHSIVRFMNYFSAWTVGVRHYCVKHCTTSEHVILLSYLVTCMMPTCVSEDQQRFLTFLFFCLLIERERSFN